MIYIFVFMATGRLLRKAEVQFSDIYLQLAAQLLLEIYQETSKIYRTHICPDVCFCLFLYIV